MFKSFFKKEEDEIFESVDPVVEKRRNEKFSKPLIYDEEFEEKQKANQAAPKPQVQKPKPEKKEPVKTEEKKEKTVYEMSQVISPMFGKSNDEEETKKKGSAPKKAKRKSKKESSLVQVLSPYYGNYDQDHKIEVEDNDAVLTASEAVEEKDKEEILTVEDNLRNIAKIVEEEQDQLKIIEERTGEFKLDFGDPEKKETTLIDEIDDNMSLDELMSLYEKKFKD